MNIYNNIRFLAESIPMPDIKTLSAHEKRVAAIICIALCVIGAIAVYFRQTLFKTTAKSVENYLMTVKPNPLVAVAVKQVDPTEPLIGLNKTAEVIRGTRIKINDDGTPGINLAGRDTNDQEFVQERIKNIHHEIGPHSHTESSLIAFRERIQGTTMHAMEFKQSSNFSLDETFSFRAIEIDRMKSQFGRQLSVAIIGLGPIGLSAALGFFKLGFQVNCYEKRAEKGEGNFAERQQPFSLERQSYWYLEYLGIPREKLLESFGYKISDNDKERHGGKIAAENHKLWSPLMAEAKKAFISSVASKYLPSNVSLTVQNVQRLLYENVLEFFRKKEPGQMNVFYESECTVGPVDKNGRRSIKLTGNQHEELITPDVIYNASGGSMNEKLGFESQKIGKYYGMGAFFPRPSVPLNESSDQKKELSRAVRVFCSYDLQQPVYCNVELNKDEFEKMEDVDLSKFEEGLRTAELASRINDGVMPKVIKQLMNDIGVTTPLRVFKIPIDLEIVKQASKIARQADDDRVFQFIFNGGDSVLKPNFLTASGANFGLLGLIELDHLLKDWLQGHSTDVQVVDRYNSMFGLLQKQSNQLILEMFGRELV